MTKRVLNAKYQLKIYDPHINRFYSGNPWLDYKKLFFPSVIKRWNQ